MIGPNRPLQFTYPIEAMKKFISDPTRENLNAVLGWECQDYRPPCERCIFHRETPRSSKCTLHSRVTLAEIVLHVIVALARYEEGGLQ